MKKFLCILMVLALAGQAAGQDDAVKPPADVPAVAPGEATKLVFDEADKATWLKITAEKAGRLLCLRQDGFGGIDVSVHDAEGKRLGGARWGDRQGFTTVAVAAGDCYVRLRNDRRTDTPCYVALTTIADDAPKLLEKPFVYPALPPGGMSYATFAAKGRGYVFVAGPEDKESRWKLNYALLDAKGEMLHTSVGARAYYGNDEWAAYRVEAGTYTLVAWNSPRSEKPFAPTLELLEELDTFEPNDTPELARTIPLYHEVSLRVLPAGDVDWLRVTVPGDGVLILKQHTWRETGIAFDAQLYDAAGKDRIALSGRRSTQEYMWWAGRVKKGEHLIAVRSQPSRKEQRFSVELQPQTDAYEPNDSPEQAAEVRGTARLRCFPPGDVDCFTIKVEEPSVLTVTQVAADGGPVRYEGGILFEGREKEKPQPLLFAWAGTDPDQTRRNRMAVVNLPVGTHKVRLQGSGSSPSLQTVRFEVAPQDDPYEPNNTRDRARPAPLGEQMRFRLPPYDDDWFYFDAPSDGIVTFHFLTHPAPADPSVYLLEEGDEQPRRLEWFTWDGGLSGTQRNYQRAFPVKKGAVYFFLRDGNDRFGHFLDFRVDYYPRSEKQDANLYLIGFQTDESADEQIKAIADAGGGMAQSTTQPAELPEILKRTVEHAKASVERQTRPSAEVKPASGYWWIWVIVAAVVLLLAALALVLRARRSSQGPQT